MFPLPWRVSRSAMRQIDMSRPLPLRQQGDSPRALVYFFMMRNTEE
jgi:hypothetical protein